MACEIRFVAYTTPESVREIIDHMGIGTGILNTDRGLFIINEECPGGKTYPKGTVFAVQANKIWAVSENAGAAQPVNE